MPGCNKKMGEGDLERASQTRYEQPNRCIAEKIISDGIKLERYFKEPEKKKGIIMNDCQISHPN